MRERKEYLNNAFFFQDWRAVSLVFPSTFVIINLRDVAKLCERQTLQVAFKRILFLHILFWNLDWQIIFTLYYRISFGKVLTLIGYIESSQGIDIMTNVLKLWRKIHKCIICPEYNKHLDCEDLRSYEDKSNVYNTAKFKILKIEHSVIPVVQIAKDTQS